jgi:hypothetical protein
VVAVRVQPPERERETKKNLQEDVEITDPVRLFGTNSLKEARMLYLNILLGNLLVNNFP